MLPARLEDGTSASTCASGAVSPDGPRMASDIDVFVRPEDAVEITRGIAQVYGELGNRENRWINRMRYLVQELGPRASARSSEKRVSVELVPAGEDLTKRYRGDHVGVHPQKCRDGSPIRPYYVGLNVPVGRMSGEQFEEAGRLAQEYGERCGRHRPEPDHHRRAPGAARRSVGRAPPRALLAEPRRLRARGRGLHGERVLPLRDRGDQDPGARVGARNGPQGRRSGRTRCGCTSRAALSRAQPQIGDIGFRGETAKKDGALVEGDIGLGGSLGMDAAFIDWVEGAKPADEVPDALARSSSASSRRREGERFHEWARRQRNVELREILGGSP